MDPNFKNPLDTRDNRDLIIMLVTKLDNIETLVENLKAESRADYDDLQDRFLLRAQEYQNRIEELGVKLQDLKHDVDKKYVTKDIFQPVKAIVYGITGTSLMGILYAILKLVNLGAK
jgi:hypothetical protein